ncbi:hypothetical protein FCR2A7T_23350 [Flavobacterium cauense R2A-7]|nr:hypothetical protein FCR2A7T_23350 [Flavobacterium cauense R2A-7]
MLTNSAGFTVAFNKPDLLEMLIPEKCSCEKAVKLSNEQQRSNCFFIQLNIKV